MIPTPDKLGLFYPSKDLTEPGTDLQERSVAAGSTSMSVKTGSITQATGYWDGALGFFYGPTTQAALRGQTFHVRKWVKDEGCLYITSPLPVVPVDTDKFKIFAGGKYASTQEVFGLMVGGKQPEADNSVTGTNITGVTIKKASGMLGEGTLSIQFNAATKGISIKMNTGLYGPEEIMSQNGTIAVYNSDYSGFVMLEVVFSALKTSGTHTDTYTLSIPKNVLIPNYEGFLEVFGYVDTGPDLSMIGPVTHTMQAIYARHEQTWKELTADEKNRFLEFFAASQTERSNYDQYHFCLRRGFSYRHILHEMKQRGMPDRSFIKADYSLLLYLEDYDAWEEWSKRQEASLMRENVHKNCVPADRNHSECGDRNPSISSVP